MQKIWDFIHRFIPKYATKPLLVSVIFNCVVYYGAKLLCDNGGRHLNLANYIDDSIPVIPAFSIIYLGCYIFWIANYIICTRFGEERCYKFVGADIIAKLICGIFFVAMPTTLPRPEIISTDLSTWLLNFVYTVDTPTNLFPSIHCMASWLCWRGLFGIKNVPKWYKVFSFVFAIAICASTLFTKQHVIIDVAAGILTAEIAYFVSKLLVNKYYKPKTAL